MSGTQYIAHRAAYEYDKALYEYQMLPAWRRLFSRRPSHFDAIRRAYRSVGMEYKA